MTNSDRKSLNVLKNIAIFVHTGCFYDRLSSVLSSSGDLLTS